MNSTSVLVKHGWRIIIQPNDELGEWTDYRPTAEPFVHEGANTRPPQPSVGRIMTKLERLNVGTGSTRTSTMGEFTTNYIKQGKTGVLSLSPEGQIAAQIVEGTLIANPTLAKQLPQDIKYVGDGHKTQAEVLAQVAKMLQHDMPVMSENAKVLASTMPKVPTDTRHNGGSGKQYPKKAKATAMIDRQSVTFTELELAALVVGKYIQFELEKNGNLRQVIGKVAYQEAKKTTSGHTIPASWRFTVDRNIDVDGMNAYNAAIDAKQDQPHPTDEQVASVIEEQTRTQPISTVQMTNGELYARDEVPVTSEPEPTQIVLSALSLGQSMLDIIDAQVMDTNASHAESENKSDTVNIETNFSDSEKIVEPNHGAKPIVQPEPTAESDIVSPTKRLGAQQIITRRKRFHQIISLLHWTQRCQKTRT